MTTKYSMEPPDEWNSYEHAEAIVEYLRLKLRPRAEGGIWKVYYVYRFACEWTSDREPINEIRISVSEDRGAHLWGMYLALSDDGSEHFRQLKAIHEYVVSEFGLRSEDYKE